jgi:hypothetical protein
MFYSTEGVCDTCVSGARAKFFGPIRVAAAGAAAVMATVASAACAGRSRQQAPFDAALRFDRPPRAPPAVPLSRIRTWGRHTAGPGAAHTWPSRQRSLQSNMIVMRTMLATVWPHVTRHGPTVYEASPDGRPASIIHRGICSVVRHTGTTAFR